MGNGLDGSDSIPGNASFFLLHSVQTGSGAYPVSYPMGIGGFSQGVKPAGCEADHSLLSSAEVKNRGAIPPLPPYVFMARCLIN
jgi:hypothetical protein